MKRQHQIDTEKAIADIISGESSARTIIAKVTPGGGKSTLPIIAGRLLLEGKVDALCWVVPRLSLQDQGERSFLDPLFMSMFDHNLTIRSSTNEIRPCRDQDGFVTTYQAIGVDNTIIKQEFQDKRYLLVLDEYHHVEEGGLWHKALLPLVENAEYCLYMTGTLLRGDNSLIAFTNYEKIEKGMVPVFNSPDDVLIDYSRGDALRERAILPLRFSLADGHIEFEDNQGKKSGTLSSMIKDANKALFSALETDFAEELLDRGFYHWEKHNLYRRAAPTKLLVVTANIEQAERHTYKIRKKWPVAVRLATSHDSSQAQENIKQFKYGDLSVLVTIAMAYEGLDCPPLSHIICLTHIRSTPWIEQMMARAVRPDPNSGPYEKQAGYVFAPDDMLFRNVISRIRKEQLLPVNPPAPREEGSGEGGGLGERSKPCEPIGGNVTGCREVFFGAPAAIINEGAGDIEIRTPKEMEQDLRKKIKAHIDIYCSENKYEQQQINADVKRAFGDVKRREMGIRQLKATVEYLKRTYPLRGPDYVPGVIDSPHPPRGSGRRVPTKAKVWVQKTLF